MLLLLSPLAAQNMVAAATNMVGIAIVKYISGANYGVTRRHTWSRFETIVCRLTLIKRMEYMLI